MMLLNIGATVHDVFVTFNCLHAHTLRLHAHTRAPQTWQSQQLILVVNKAELIGRHLATVVPFFHV